MFKECPSWHILKTVKQKITNLFHFELRGLKCSSLLEAKFYKKKMQQFIIEKLFFLESFEELAQHSLFDMNQNRG